MKKLSVVIVNYNVRHFLEQCLLAVHKACKGIDAEVFVVDNNSVDGSVAMVQEKFPWVTLIANTVNEGFSKANNRAIQRSDAEFVLLLNPDTVVEEETFARCIEFMESKPDAGGLGVYMVDGKGQFLAESKRSMPTPAVAFYKIFGLSSVFPNSKRFGKYHLGYLDKHQIHEVEVLSGAFMMLRRETLDKTGLLDENFFMYGEDIDLSYRITQAGYKNYYFPGTRIIHYKGESTKKSSLNYVFVFYQAMIIFARKHFSGKNARLFTAMIHLAIYFRAFIAIARRTMSRLVNPLLDAGILWGGIYLIKEYWVTQVKFGHGADYPNEFMMLVVPAYIVIWLISMLFSGVYDRPVILGRIWRGMVAGTIIILVGYALLPESWRFSRALIILGFFWGLMVLPSYRYLLSLTGINFFKRDTGKLHRIAIVGSLAEGERVADLVRKTQPGTDFIGLVTPNPESDQRVLGHLGQLQEIVSVYGIRELIFCLKDLEAKTIIDLMSNGLQGNPEFRIAPPETHFLVGSGSIHSAAPWQMIPFNTIGSKANRRNKRFLDLAISLLLTALLPLAIPLQQSPTGFLRNLLQVMIGRKSWVGYHSGEPLPDEPGLPTIRNGVLGPADGLKQPVDQQQMLQGLNLLYAKDYTMLTDLVILIRNFRKLGRS
jgi:O-antigen biosynthesis protein